LRRCRRDARASTCAWAASPAPAPLP
jgi:hypothetical protein